VATAAGSGQGRVRIAITLATLSATAFLSARGTTQLVASAFFDVPVEVGDRAPVSTATASTTSHRDGHPLLAHQIFDSALGTIPWDDPVVEPEPGSEEGDEVVAAPTSEWHDGDPIPAACDGSIRLVGAYVRRGSEAQSFAAITNATGSSLLYREGMTLDDRGVVAIRSNFVVLRPGSGTLCSISMFDTGEAVATARTDLVVTPPAPAADGTGDVALGITAAEMESNIHQVSDTNYTINRTLVDRLLANQAALMSAARVIPHEEDGRVVGVKIYGIRRSSLLGHLGIQNGDMMRTINGYDLTDPTAVLDAYSHLRTADQISISVVRRGQPVTMDYGIQ
jgi:general secretion pathway protein C